MCLGPFFTKSTVYLSAFHSTSFIVIEFKFDFRLAGLDSDVSESFVSVSGDVKDLNSLYLLSLWKFEAGCS